MFLHPSGQGITLPPSLTLYPRVQPPNPPPLGQGIRAWGWLETWERRGRPKGWGKADLPADLPLGHTFQQGLEGCARVNKRYKHSVGQGS